MFQYKGLLEADPTSGAYKKVIPNRLVDPIDAGRYQNGIQDKQVGSGKLVTWRPSLETTKKPTASWTKFFTKRTEPPRNLLKSLTTQTYKGQDYFSEPKTIFTQKKLVGQNPFDPKNWVLHGSYFAHPNP